MNKIKKHSSRTLIKTEQQEEEQVKLADDLATINNILSKYSGYDEIDLRRLFDTEKDLQLSFILNTVGVLTKIAGNINKVHEKASMIQLSLEQPEIKIEHVSNSYGADIISQSDQGEFPLIKYYEHKSSTTKKTLEYKTNWMFETNIKAKSENILVIATSLYKKMKGGGTIFEAFHNNTIINRYIIHGWFIALAVSHRMIKNSKRHVNLGSERCPHCHEYHKMLHYLGWSTILEKRLNDLGIDKKNHSKMENEMLKHGHSIFNHEEWIAIEKNIPAKTQCKIFSSQSK